MEKQEIIKSLNLTHDDLNKLDEHGVSLSAVSQQVNQISEGTKYIKLNRPCKIGDGIVQIREDEKEELVRLQEEYVKTKSVIKFVPASGAASRMFKVLESFMNSEIIESESKSIINENEYVNRFFNNIEHFAFYTDLKETIRENGLELESLLSKNQYRTILKFLLTQKGLNYSSLPKGLIEFHNYEDETRNAFEEHIAVAKGYIRNSANSVNIHFTITPEFQSIFDEHIRSLIKKYSISLNNHISYSFQKKSTDTVALDMEDKLFRDGSELLFRPGGHGALIENLNDLDNDLIYVKNIDNVQRQENLETTINYKKLIGGLLVKHQKIIHSFLLELEQSISAEKIEEVKEFITTQLQYDLNKDFDQLSDKEKVNKLFSFLNRPIRVCAMVLNEDHPGGGPFWVEDENGMVSKQIIEGNQIDKSNNQQHEIFNSSTHFNPVDIVCGVKDYKGNKFDLLKFVDDSAVLVSIKSKDGKELKALELPGLWNGGMANWITIFVEVPKETFTPVKEVNDLLKEYHRASF